MRPVRLLVTVTFNPNQLRSHLEPIAAIPEVEEIILVTDRRPPPIPKLRAVVPPPLLSRLFGRAFAKLLVLSVLARRLRPKWVIGFNLVPHGLNAILSARLVRSRLLYVMIGGPIEWEGGGLASDNRLLGRRQRRSLLLEHLLLAGARRATSVVTMGSRGREALLARGFDAARVVAIPASVDEALQPRDVEPTWDAITVGELIPRKRTADLIEAVAVLAPERPQLRIAIAGTGPLLDELQDHARRLGVESHVEFLGFREDIAELYARSRVFVLPSRFEGLSISLLEAMASGLPVVVSDVGEARDVVRHGEHGFLYPPGDVADLSRRLSQLLDDLGLSRELGQRAARDAQAHAGVRTIAAAYRRLLAPDEARSRA
jgi:glycosyltransferase involved in cell wall biosynthesis